MGVTLRKSLNIVDALASKILLNNIATLLGELLVALGGAGLLVGVAVQLDLGVRRVLEEGADIGSMKPSCSLMTIQAGIAL